MSLTARALGPAPLCQDGGPAQRVADLAIYVRQSHAERDLEQLARLAGQRREISRRPGNTARFAAQPLSGGGTGGRLVDARRELPVLDLSSCPEIVVVAAHPDDETSASVRRRRMLAAAGVPVGAIRK